MKSKLRYIGYPIIAILFWTLVWQTLALIIDLDFVFPRVDTTMSVLFKLIFTPHFWITVSLSILRILAGFIIGVILGILIAPLTHRFEIANAIIAPAMTIIKSTPVASFILVLWCLIGKDSVPTVIGVLMVMPIIWQNLSNGFKSINAELGEVCKIYEIAPFKKFKVLIFPTLVKFLIPAMVTSSALAWKSGIAAEIIVYARNSIGKEITDAKNFFESETMFAWTIAVVILSTIIEYTIKRITKAVRTI